MSKVVTLGEIMLRLTPPQHQRIMQTSSFDVCYGGAEANVAVSLSQFGHEASFISKYRITVWGTPSSERSGNTALTAAMCEEATDGLGSIFWKTERPCVPPPSFMTGKIP